MDALIIIAVATILHMLNIITPYVYLIITISGVVWTFVGSCLYFKFGFLKFYYHNILGWHTPDNSPQRSDGCSQHATCKYCGEDIMMDSQGNWF